MKSIIKRIAPAAVLMLGLVSCSEDSWNNHLDGFEGGQDLSQVESVSYTLTDADYGRFANNRFNKALAVQDSVNGIDPNAIKALKAVASQHYITSSTPAERYMPNLLLDSLFKYFALSDGSAINLTYNEAGELPALMKSLNGAASYEVSEADYQQAYGSDKDYALSFTPSYSFSSLIPAILKKNMPDAADGEYVVVTYDYSNTDPQFDAPAFEMTDVLKGDLAEGDMVKVDGVVTAVCTQGFILSDKAGSILVYGGSGYDGAFAVGDQLEVDGEIGSFKNCMQIAYGSASIVKKGSESYAYPNPVDLTPDYLVNANKNTAPVLAVYGTMTGTVGVSDKFINIAFDGRSDVRGSVYNATDDVKAELTDGRKVRLKGYFTQTSQSGDIVNANFVVTNVESASAKAPRKNGKRRVVALPSVKRYGVFVKESGNWKYYIDTELTLLQPSDYGMMSLGYGNFQGTQPQEYLPIFLSRMYPYAKKGDMQYVAYRYYSNRVTANACAQWEFDGTKWYDKIAANGVQSITKQYVKRDGVWKYDPSIEITLPVGKGQAFSASFYQACVDWVKDNVPDGAAYITSYGNNDYYTGCSAYQNNIDLRPGSARLQYAKAYEGMTDDEVVALMKKRFEDEVCPGVLAERYPDLEPIGDFHPTITIHFWIYDGATHPQTIVFECVAKGQYKFKSCTWNNTEE